MSISNIPPSLSFRGSALAHGLQRQNGPGQGPGPNGIGEITTRGNGGDALDRLEDRFGKLLERIKSSGDLNIEDRAALRDHAETILGQIKEAVAGRLATLSEHVPSEYQDGIQDYADIFEGAIDNAFKSASEGDSFDIEGVINDVREAFKFTIDGLRSYLGDDVPGLGGGFGGATAGALLEPGGGGEPPTGPNPPPLNPNAPAPQETLPTGPGVPGDLGIQPIEEEGEGGSGPTTTSLEPEVGALLQPETGQSPPVEPRSNFLEISEIRTAPAYPRGGSVPPQEPEPETEPGPTTTSLEPEVGALLQPETGQSPPVEPRSNFLEISEIRTAPAYPRDTTPNTPVDPAPPTTTAGEFLAGDISRDPDPSGPISRPVFDFARFFGQVNDQFESLLQDLELLRRAHDGGTDHVG